MVEFLMVALLCAMVILLIVIAGLVADNNRISREIHAKNIEVTISPSRCRMGRLNLCGMLPPTK